MVLNDNTLNHTSDRGQYLCNEVTESFPFTKILSRIFLFEVLKNSVIPIFQVRKEAKRCTFTCFYIGKRVE